MSTVLYADSNAGTLRHYLADVSNAARAFAAALFAAQGRQFIAQEVRAEAAVSERSRQKSKRQLMALANTYEQFTPNLAAELRHLASRD